MKKRIGVLFLISVLVFTFLCTAASSGLGADEATAEEVLAEAEAGIEALEATAAVKERLRTMARTWLRDGERAGLSGERLRELMQAMVRLCAECDLERELGRLRSACQLMIREMKEGGSSERVCNMLCERLQAGENLSRALKAVQREMAEAHAEKKLEEKKETQDGKQGGPEAGGTGGPGGPQGGGGGGSGSGPGGAGGKA
ncbi:MAG: hypothetical protein K6U03_06070 [Firmicutes bacterium]|nr:hypothetical protein [Bacillota bacterium]